MSWDEMSSRERDALVAEHVMDWGECLGFAEAWGECGPDNVHAAPGDYGTFLDRCVCEDVRESNRRSIAACVEEYGWTEEDVAEQRARHASEWIFGHSWQCLRPSREWSTDISAAWEVVEKMLDDGWPLTLEVLHKGWEARMHRGGFESIYEMGAAPTAPEAICIAALRAKGVEV